MEMRTRNDHYHNKKVPGSGSAKNWIAPNKVALFKTLFDAVRKRIGTYRGAQEFIGLSGCVRDGLEKGKISVDTGAKILAAYNRIKAEQSQE